MIYFVFLCISLLSLMLMKRTKVLIGKYTVTVNFGEIVTIALFALLTAARASFIGTDTINYVYSANAIQHNYSSIASIFNGYYIEPGYGVLELITMKWFGDVHYLFLIESLILLAGVFSFIHNFEKKISVPLAFLVFFCFNFNPSLNISRQYIAVGIGLFSAKYLLNKRIAPYFICCVIAMMFHSTGLLLFFSYFVWVYLFSAKEKKSFVKRVAFLMACIILLCALIRPITTALANIGVVPIKYANLLHTTDATSSGVLTIMVNAPLIILIVLLKNQLLKYDEKNKIVITLCLMGFFVSMLNTVFGNVGRISVFWSIWQIVLYPECCRLLCVRQKNSLGKLFIGTVFVLFFISYWFYCYVFRAFGETVPYVSDVFNWMNWNN